IRSDRVLADAAAHAVGTEVFPAHGVLSALKAHQTLRASSVSRTSWTRTKRAPFCTASTAATTLPMTRSSTGRPVRSPIVRLRERPARIGYPSDANFVHVREVDVL